MARYSLNTPFYIRFEVEKIKYRNKQFAICDVKILKHKSSDILPKKMVVKGDFLTIFVSNIYVAIVAIGEDPSWGFFLQLKSSPEEVISNSKRGMTTFLKNSVGKDITQKEAEALVEEVGLDIIDKVKQNSAALDGVKSLTTSKKKKVTSAIRQHAFFKELLLKVSGNGLPAEVANYIYDKYGEESLNVLTNKPYSLINVPGLDFTTVDKIACVNGRNYCDYMRIKAVVTAIVKSYVENGGFVCIEKSTILKKFNRFVSKKGYFAKNIPINVNVVNEMIKQMVDDGYLREEIYDGKSYLYRPTFYTNERNIAAYIKDFNEKWDSAPLLDETTIKDFIDAYEKNYLTLSNGQKNAIYMALQNKFSILTGGPGTGKTQTVNTILKCLSEKRPDIRVTLMAPTGKASNRMRELTNREATTIHRGIKLNLFDKDNETEILDTDFVIVDESSMIDAYLFEQLMANIPSEAAVLFVGDVDQLPSVGAGNVLKDMIDCGMIATTRLTEVFRQAMSSNIVKNSHRIMAPNVTVNDLDLDDKTSDFYFVDKENVRDILDEVEATYRKLLDDGCRVEDICILAPIEDSEIGNYSLNHIIQEKFNPSQGADKEYMLNDIDVLRVGDRVMQMVNNYDLGVMNGESGVIIDIRERQQSGRKEIEIEFPGHDENVIYFGGQTNELKLSYACSIHKMQGSEVPYVIHIIHNSQKQMLTRNLIYTAWTRAKKQVVIIGQREALDKAIKNTQSNLRTTLLKERIRGDI